jgi:ring-1,2-phenylacetyl-CoA epoxidase subunit PaaB
VSSRESWPLWEVFVRSRAGLAHQHVGSLHAADAEMALANARDVYTRRGEGASLWVVPADAIVASDPDDKESFFGLDEEFRHPSHYVVPDGVVGI